MEGKDLYELFVTCSDLDHLQWEFVDTLDKETWDLLARKVKLVDA